MKYSQKLGVWLALVALLLALASVVPFWAFGQIEQSAIAQKSSLLEISTANDLLSKLRDADADQRGYTLTGDETFLASYGAMREGIKGQLAALRQLAMIRDSHKRLDALGSLIDAKLLEMSQVIELRRSQGAAAALALLEGGLGRNLMDSIRIEMHGFIQTEEAALAQHDLRFQTNLRRLFATLVVASVLALLSALAFAYFIFQGFQQRLKNLVHLETRHLLDIQEDINRQLRQSNLALQEGEEKLAVTLNSIGDAVIATDANARVTFLNPVAEKLTGWVQGQARGRPVEDVFSIINKETRQPVPVPIVAALKHGAIQGIANHTVLIASDGRECDISDSCAPIRNAQAQVVGAVLVFRDVSKEYAVQHAVGVQRIELESQNNELRQSQVALDVLRARYFDLYDLAPVGYCTLSEAGLLMEANFTAATLLGLARGDLVKQWFSRFICHEDADKFHLLSKNVLDSGESQACEIRMLKTDGSQFWAHLAASAAQDDGRRVIRVVISNIDERKRVEAEREQLDQALRGKNVELENARLAAEKANQAKSDFLSSMSHELRTPLSAILGFAQLLESGSPVLTPSQKRGIDQILRAGWYLLELINEVLDLALIESGKLSLSMEPVALEDVIHECETMIEPQAQSRNVHVTFSHPEIIYYVHADRTRIKQVLINLLSNAIKYNKVGGAVHVACSLSPPDSIRVSVEDTGVGLSTQQLAQLFQPFNRLGQEGNAEEGTGIGLVVCKRLIDMMNGRIGFKSTVGEGSVFWFEIAISNPPRIADSTTEDKQGVRLQAPGEEQLHTLLYVEDNPANLMLVEDLIARRPDIRLLTARDGNRGIALARSTLPDVILMDINLPGISGLDALSILAEDPATAHIPVVALSANAIPRDIEKGLDAGFFRYLTKPIKVNEFMDSLDLAMKFAETQAALKTKKEQTP